MNATQRQERVELRIQHKLDLHEEAKVRDFWCDKLIRLFMSYLNPILKMLCLLMGWFRIYSQRMRKSESGACGSLIDSLLERESKSLTRKGFSFFALI